MRLLQLRLLLVLATLIAALAGMTPNAPAQDYRQTVLGSNPLGYWRFESDANSAVNGYTGTFQGAATLSPAGTGAPLTAFPNNHALLLNGTPGTFVNTDLVGGIGTSGSMVAWINLAQLPADAGRIYSIAGQSQFANDFDIGIFTDNTVRFYTGAGNYVQSAPLTNADLNTWHSVAATFTSNGTASLYLDGVLVQSGVAGNHVAGSGTFAIGESDFFTGRQFNGLIDEVAVWNRELSASEVLAIYDSRLNATAAPEPTTLLPALGAGALGLFRLRRRRQTKPAA